MIQRSERFDTNPQTPKAKPMAMANGTETATRDSEFIDLSQYPTTTM